MLTRGQNTWMNVLGKIKNEYISTESNEKKHNACIQVFFIIKA